jgi:hypothetical protein
VGLHASYYPIRPPALAHFLALWHSEGYWKDVSSFREEATKNGQEFYVGTTWHVLDFIINPPGNEILELRYAVRGHPFPAPDGSVSTEPRMPSYDDEYWQVFSYVSAEEAAVIAQLLPLIDESEFRSRFDPEKMASVYRAPAAVDGGSYLEMLSGLREFYQRAAHEGMAVLISTG